MSEIEEIRQRDREAIPRFGPDKDPLLRAEMDRRWLLNNMYTRQQVGEYQAREARLVSEPLRLKVERLETQVEDLQRQLAEATGQTEAAKQATREIMAERNTWARQLADMRDERNTAREETEKARELAAIASTDRDNLHIAIEEVIVEWETSAARPLDNPMLNWQARHAVQLRRVIARWETT